MIIYFFSTFHYFRPEIFFPKCFIFTGILHVLQHNTVMTDIFFYISSNSYSDLLTKLNITVGA